VSFPRYPEYKDSGVEWLGNVPAHWGVVRVKHVLASMGSGGTPDTDNEHFWADHGGTPWVAIGDMSDRDFVDATAKRLSALGVESKRLSVWPAGTLLFSMYASLGHVAELRVPAATNQAILALVPQSDTSQAFLKRWFQFVRPSLREHASSNTQDNLNAEKVRNLLLARPPLPEQRAIAAFLDRETAKIDALVAEQERLIELLKEKRQAVISHAVTKGLNPDAPMKDSGIEWLGEVPAHWEATRLRHLVVEGIAGPYGASLTKAMYVSEGYRVYGQQQVIPNDFAVGDYFISEDKYLEMSRYAVRAGDVLISVMGTIGKVAVVPAGASPGIINPRLVLYRCGSAIVPPFLRAALMSSRLQKEIQLEAQGSTMDGLNMRILADIVVPLPPIAEQLLILAHIDTRSAEFDALIAEAETAIALLQERRSALISAAVTGQIDVRGLVNEVAA
jgi:type I restriction enzyme S subunit